MTPLKPLTPSHPTHTVRTATCAHTAPSQKDCPMKFHHPLAALLLAAATLSAGIARAGDGHDHGDAPPAANGPAQPRFSAVSETFELVGVLSGKRITLYLDRSADNSPVHDAVIELEIAGVTHKAETHGEAEFDVMLAEAPKPGVLPITATVTVGKETDLLAGELDIHEPARAEAAQHHHHWEEYAAWAAAAAAAFLLAWGARRALGPRRQRAGGAA